MNRKGKPERKGLKFFLKKRGEEWRNDVRWKPLEEKKLRKKDKAYHQ